MKIHYAGLSLLDLVGHCLGYNTHRHQGSPWGISTSSGFIQGHPALNASGVTEYLGIPFAQPPVGNLRFAAPLPYNGTDNINASAYGYSCAILPATPPIKKLNYTVGGLMILQDIGQTFENFSEDCLFLNIWNKPTSTKKPVLVFIPGGSFTSGSGAGPEYNGEFFADQEDVVVVTINYRLNIFGFPGIPGSPSNLGLLDQRLAVEWVRDNIAAFGGDPSRITLFGQSAGGASVDIYNYAYKSDPIVAGFIPQSGLAQLEVDTALTAKVRWYAAVAAVGCGTVLSSNSSILSCMRKLNTTALTTAAKSLAAFIPYVDHQVVFDDYPTRAQNGNFTLKPVLLGHTNNEAGLFEVLYAMQDIVLPNATWESFQTSTYACPVAARANVSVFHDLPVWRYTYYGEFPNTQLLANVDSGAWHGSDIFALMNQFPRAPGVPANTPRQDDVVRYMQGAWAAFARDPVAGLSEYGWPQFNPNTESLMRLGIEGPPVGDLASAADFDGGCGAVFAAFQ